MADLIADLLRQNEWANLRLLEACRGLSDEQLEATAGGVYGSIRATLVHLAGAEGRYALLLGNDSGIDIRTDDPWPGFDFLAATLVTNAAALRECAGRGVDGQFVQLQDDQRTNKVGDATVVLVQAFNHGTEHRSHVCTVLTTLGIEPPEIDGWTWGDADDRVKLVPAGGPP